MTAIDVLTQKLVALGATTEMIVLVVEAVTVARDGHRVTRDKSHFVTPEDVRHAAKMRKRKQRNKEKLERLAADAAKANDVAASTVTVTRDACDMSQKCTPLLSSSTASLEVVIEEGSKKKKARSENARARGTRMQPGAPLTDEFRQAAIDLGAPPQVVPEMWSEHVDYWVAVPGERGVKTDWLATWRNDVRRKLKMGTYNGQRTHAHASPRRSGADDFFAGLAEVAADIDRDCAMARPADADIPRGRVEIDGSGAPGSDYGAGADQGRDQRR